MLEGLGSWKTVQGADVSPLGNWRTIDNSDKLDGALIVGRTYDDSGAGIHITPVATGNNSLNEEYIDVAINLGNFSANRSPVISAFTATTNQAALNQAVNFSVTASDPDGDVLAYLGDSDWSALMPDVTAG